MKRPLWKEVGLGIYWIPQVGKLPMHQPVNMNVNPWWLNDWPPTGEKELLEVLGTYDVDGGCSWYGVLSLPVPT